MRKTRIINFRVSAKQYELIQLRKEAAGYQSLSQWVRDLMLKDDLQMIYLIKEIHKEIVSKKID
jgi:hypothetical protein